MVKIKKLPKDPRAPKMPKSPFIYFSMEVSKDVRDELSRDPSLMGKEVNFQQQSKINKACGKKWKALSESEKEKYQIMYKEDIKRYEKEMRSYTPSPEHVEKVERAKFLNSRSVVNNLDTDIAKVPHMVRAYFDYLTNTWSRVSVANPRLNPRQVQDEVWMRWSRGESSSGGACCNDWDENRNLQKTTRKRIRKESTSLKSNALKSPRQAFQCFLEQMNVELRKLVPNMPYSEIVEHASAKWKNMSLVQKEPFFVLEKEEKGNYEDHSKQSKLECEKEPSLKEESVVLSRAVRNNENKSGDVADDVQKNENAKSKSFLMKNVEQDVGSSTSLVDDDSQIHSQEECSFVAVQKDEAENTQGVNMLPSSSSSSSDDSSDDSDADSDTTNNDSRSDCDS